MKNKQFLAIILVMAVAVSFFGAANASAMTEQQRQSLIASIKQQILVLQQQLSALLAQQNSANINAYVPPATPVPVADPVPNPAPALAPESAIIQETPLSVPDPSPFSITIPELIDSPEIEISHPSPSTSSKSPLSNRYFNCTSNWQCSDWSGCEYPSTHQTRTCTDVNKCLFPANEPQTFKNCQPCVPNWQCGEWGECQGEGKFGDQKRTCVDANNCGRPQPTMAGEPAISKTCYPPGSAHIEYFTVKNGTQSNGSIIYSVPYGSTMTLSWNAKQANSCAITSCIYNGGAIFDCHFSTFGLDSHSLPLPSSGTLDFQNMNSSNAKIYTLICMGDKYGDTASVGVRVPGAREFNAIPR